MVVLSKQQKALTISIAILYDDIYKKRNVTKKRKAKRFWVRKLYQERKSSGFFHVLTKELELFDREYFFRFMRMSPDRYEHLLSIVGPKLQRQKTHLREPISPSERLTLTLRYLASGESQQSLSFSFRISRTAISNILADTCEKIWDSLCDIYVQPPRSEVDWLNISDGFLEDWDMVHCIGAIDGKHVAIECPKNSGSLYYNYKGFFSIVLMAVCDARYCFTLVNVGDFGSNNDSGILAKSSMGKRFEEQKMNVPNAKSLLGYAEDNLPFFLVGDEIFPLKTWLMRPYPGNLSLGQKIFNYRLSRARRTIENSFGILAARWRFFRQPIKAKVENAEKFTLAAIALHNYLRLTNNASYSPTGFIDSETRDGKMVAGAWRKVLSDDGGANALRDLPHVRGSRYQKCAIIQRDNLQSYFMNTGTVEWQISHVTSCGPVMS